MKTEHKVFAASIFFGLSVWIIDAVLDYLIFYEGTFIDLLILKIPQHELYIRCLILGFFLIFGLLLSRVLSKQIKFAHTLKENEEKHRTLFETMAQGVVYQDRDGKIFSANKAAEKILGLTLDEMQGRTSIDPRWKAIHEDGSDFPGEDHPAMVALKTGKEVHNVLMGIFNPKLEDYTWININAIPQFRSGEKSPYQVYTTFEDITIQKKAEEELHQYEYIINSSTDMMALLDNQFKYMAANKTYLDAFNLTSEKLIGQTVSEVFGKEFFEIVIKSHAEKCLSGETINYQDWFEFPALGRKYMDISYFPYRGSSDKIQGFAVTGRDNTERKNVETEFKNIFNLSPDMVAVFTTEGGLLKVNPSWEKMLGYTQKELLGMGWTKLVHPDDVDNTNAEVEKQLKGSSIVNFVNRYKCKDGSYKTLEWQATSAEEGIVHATARDITKRKKAEKQLEKSQKDLKKLTAHLQTVREEERTLVAHELHDVIGQALSALKMDIFMLKKKLPKDQKDISDQIKETNDLLDKTIQTTRKIYSELRPTLLEHFSIKEVLEDLLGTFKESNNFSGDTAIDLEGIELKEEQSIAIYRIVQEALNNIKWHSQAKTVKIRLKMKKNQLKLMIKDDGIGIKEDDLIKSNAFGTLGMKERAEFLGGAIEFKGIPEKGTTVTVTIPLNPESD